MGLITLYSPMVSSILTILIHGLNFVTLPTCAGTWLATSMLIVRVNYSKPTCGLARFNITYPWFKTCHFTHLRFKTLAAVTHLAHFC